MYMDVAFAMYTCAKMDAILPTIINNIKLLSIFFFLKLPLMSAQNFLWAVLDWFDLVIKASWIVYLNSLTHAVWIIVMDWEGCPIKD